MNTQFHEINQNYEKKVAIHFLFFILWQKDKQR